MVGKVICNEGKSGVYVYTCVCVCVCVCIHLHLYKGTQTYIYQKLDIHFEDRHSFQKVTLLKSRVLPVF